MDALADDPDDHSCAAFAGNQLVGTGFMEVGDGMGQDGAAEARKVEGMLGYILDPAHAGCKSWVPLEASLPTDGLTPALDLDAFRQGRLQALDGGLDHGFDRVGRGSRRCIARLRRDECQQQPQTRQAQRGNHAVFQVDAGCSPASMSSNLCRRRTTA